MNEADAQTKFNRWLRAKWSMGKSAVFELKICKEKGGIPFSAVKEHQINALLAAKHGKLIYKIPDVGYDQKPFDDICLSGIKAYVVIIYHKTREYTRAYMIDVDVFVAESETSQRRSFLETRASELAEMIVDL